MVAKRKIKKVQRRLETVVMNDQHDRVKPVQRIAQFGPTAAAFDPAQNLDVLGFAVQTIDKTYQP